MHSQDLAKTKVKLLLDYHFSYSKEINNYKPTIYFSGNLKQSIDQIEDKLYELLGIIYQDFYDTEEALRYAYEESITALTQTQEELNNA